MNINSSFKLVRWAQILALFFLFFLAILIVQIIGRLFSLHFPILVMYHSKLLCKLSVHRLQKFGLLQTVPVVYSAYHNARKKFSYKNNKK